MKLWLKTRFLPYIVFVIHWLLSRTWRTEIVLCEELKEDLKNKKTAILAHWHQDETVLVLSIRRLRAAILNSKSTDGQMMARVVRLYGAKTAKGSSSRGGVEGLKGLIRLGKEGYNPAIAVDGPRGPRHEIKNGVFQISRFCRAKIYPATVSYGEAWHFPKSWDKTYLPKPFSKVVIHWGRPLSAIDKSMDPKSPELAQSLVYQFDESAHRAQQLFTRS